MNKPRGGPSSGFGGPEGGSSEQATTAPKTKQPAPGRPDPLPGSPGPRRGSFYGLSIKGCKHFLITWTVFTRNPNLRSNLSNSTAQGPKIRDQNV